jgi:hypothetical protein
MGKPSPVREAFLNELSQLSTKYGLSIGGCGCCGSPNVAECGPGHYTIGDDGSDLTFEEEKAEADEGEPI